MGYKEQITQAVTLYHTKRGNIQSIPTMNTVEEVLVALVSVLNEVSVSSVWIQYEEVVSLLQQPVSHPFIPFIYPFIIDLICDM